MYARIFHKIDLPMFKGSSHRIVDAFELDQVWKPESRSRLVDSPDKDVLEYIFRIHNNVNGNERNVFLKLRSLSVGDIVELSDNSTSHGRRYLCAPTGWEVI
jgi:hypothetical protein